MTLGRTMVHFVCDVWSQDIGMTNVQVKKILGALVDQIITATYAPALMIVKAEPTGKMLTLLQPPYHHPPH